MLSEPAETSPITARHEMYVCAHFPFVPLWLDLADTGGDPVKMLLRQFADALDRPIPGLMLYPLATLRSSRRHRRLVRVTDEAGLWVHHHRAAKLVFRDFSPISPEELDAATHACFFHAYTPKQGDVAIEVGAGVGGETLSVSRLVGQTGRVIAIEAHPETYRCLKMLCTLNALDNVTTRQAAVMNQHGSIRISDLDTHVMNSVLGSAKTGIEVPAITLDDLVEAEGLTRIDFLKMNIEGAELLALQGMRDTLGMVQNLVVSCHDFVADQTGDDSMRTKSRVREVLEASGFVVSDRATHRSPWIRDALYGKKRVS